MGNRGGRGVRYSESKISSQRSALILILILLLHDVNLVFVWDHHQCWSFPRGNRPGHRVVLGAGELRAGSKILDCESTCVYMNALRARIWECLDSEEHVGVANWTGRYIRERGGKWEKKRFSGTEIVIQKEVR